MSPMVIDMVIGRERGNKEQRVNVKYSYLEITWEDDDGPVIDVNCL